MPRSVKLPQESACSFFECETTTLKQALHVEEHIAAFVKKLVIKRNGFTITSHFLDNIGYLAGLAVHRIGLIKVHHNSFKGRLALDRHNLFRKLFEREWH